MPTVAILVPTYEPDPAQLRAALDAVFRQTEQDFTVLIHDDASKTDVVNIVAPYLASDRCRFLRSDRRQGIAGNWNACLKHTTELLVQYLFQDDVWNERYLEHAKKAMTEGVGLVFTAHKYRVEGTMRFDKDMNEWYRDVEQERAALPKGRQGGRVFLERWMERGLHPNLIGEPSFVLVRRELLHAAGPFDTSLPQGLDIDMWAKILPETDLAFVPQDGGFFRVHVQGASARNRMEGRGLIDRLAVLERIARKGDKELRKQAKAAIRRELSGMFRKAQGRKKGSGGGLRGREVMRFFKIATRHPLLCARGVLKI